MKALNITNWYGKGREPKQSANEKRLLARYRERLEERRLSEAVPKFDPKKGPYAELYYKEVEIIAKLIKPGDVVLDVGAGRGRLVQAALDQGALKVFALEPDSRAVNTLSEKFRGKSVCSVLGKAQSMLFLADGQVDLSLFVGNSLGMMWDVPREWEGMFCRQKEALLEMLRVARREVAFIVYGKQTMESALEAYLDCQDNVIDIQDGLMLVEEMMDSRKPYKIATGSGRSHERFVYQKFDREYLENLLKDVGLSEAQFSIKGIPEGTEYGYLVTIPPS